MQPETVSIKFKAGDLEKLRARLLQDLSKEYAAVLHGSIFSFPNSEKVVVIENMVIPNSHAYIKQHLTGLELRKEFVFDTIIQAMNFGEEGKRAIIVVHVHPFDKDKTSFSGIDDADDRRHFKFVEENLEGITCLSIVFSQNEYSARLVYRDGEKISFRPAVIKTPNIEAEIPSCDFRRNVGEKQSHQSQFMDRTIRALGFNTMAKWMGGRQVTIVGAGGLGSIICEEAVQMGFGNIVLIDHDEVDMSNLNRLAGANYLDALCSRPKVDVIARRAQEINPFVKIRKIQASIEDPLCEEAIANSDQVIVGTDNHSSRYSAQVLCQKYATTLISAGVNITVRDDGQISDRSGEVITVRPGDHHCLLCLRRINPVKVGFEKADFQEQKDIIKKRGYVVGVDIAQPAVRTLNSIVASMTVDTLVNLYAGFQEVVPIHVYEDNKSKRILQDEESLKYRHLHCNICS